MADYTSGAGAGGGGGGGWGDGSPQSSGVYWVGTDGKVYVSGGQGTNAAGVADNNTDTYWGNLGYSRIADPNPSNAGNQYNGVAGGAALNGSTGSAPFDPASYDQQINYVNSALGRLGQQQTSGFTGIDNSYNTALQQLLGSKNIAQRNYDTTKQTQATDYVGAKNSLGAQAGNALRGLYRLLGSRGISGSPLGSAKQAVGNEYTQNRTGTDNTFGQNQRTLDTNWNDYLTGYNNQVTGAAGQRDEQKRTLGDNITNNRVGLLNQLASLQAQRAAGTGGNAVAASQPYLDQANTYLNQLANSAPAQINYQTQAYQAPSLASYTAPKYSQPTSTNQAGGDYFSPYLSALLGKKQQIA